MPTLQPPIPKCPWAHISSFDLLKGLKLQDNTHYLYRPLILKLWDQILMVPMEYLPLGYSRNYIVGCILSQMPYIVVTVNLQTWCRVQVSFHVAVFKRKSEKKKKSRLRERLTYDLQITRVSGRGSERESVCVCVRACVRCTHACSVMSSSLQPCGL